LRLVAGEKWVINSKSGRYSGDYSKQDTKIYLNKVISKLESIFPYQKDKITSA